MSAVSQPPVGCRASCNLFFISMGNKVGDGLALSDFVCQWAEVGLDLNDFLQRGDYWKKELETKWMRHTSFIRKPMQFGPHTSQSTPDMMFPLELQQQAYQGCSFVIGLSKEAENDAISWKNVEWALQRSANRAVHEAEKTIGSYVITFSGLYY